MAFPSYSKIAILDGIRVPIIGFQGSWGVGGVVQFQVTLAPSYRAFDLHPSTFVHIYHVETSKYGYTRSSVGAYLKDAVKGDLSSTDPREVGYLATDHLAQLGATTVGRLIPLTRVNRPGHRPGDDLALQYVHDHGLIYLCGGLVQRKTEAGGEGQGNTVTLHCRGYEYDIEQHRITTLVRGRGTLTARERRYTGQDTKNEGKPKTILSGGSKRSTPDEIASLLVKSGDYAIGMRRLVAQFPALSNEMWLHRYAWTRIGDQIAIIENDSSPKRLIGTATFKKYLLDQLSRLYQMPLRSVLEIILGFIGYRLVSIPAPSFFPIVPEPTPEVTIREESFEQEVPAGVRVQVRWYPYQKYNPADLPAGCTAPRYDSAQRSYVVEVGGVEQTIPTTHYGGGVVPGTLEDGARRVDFTLPTQTPQGLPVLGGGVSLSASALGFGPGDISVPTPRFVPGKSWIVTPSLKVAAGGQGLSMRPGTGLRLKITVFKPTTRTVTRKRKVPEEKPPQQPAKYFDNVLCRLNTYVIVPDLWWAAPPACNVIVPEQIISWQRGSSPAEVRTRTLGKIPPGQPGSGKVFVGTFSAPNVEDLNAALEDTADDPVDATNLLPYEYVAGVQAQVETFGLLPKMAAAPTWKRYIRSMLVQQHWAARFQEEQAVILLKTAVGLVPGTTCLVIRSTADGALDNALTPEQMALLAKLRQLRAILVRLKRARAGLQAQVRRAQEVRRWIRQLRALSEVMHTEGFKDVVPPESVEGAWEKTGGKLERVYVGRTSRRVRGAADQRRADGALPNVALPAGVPAARLEEISVLDTPEVADLNDPSYQQTFRTLIGEDGLKIWPSGAQGTLSSDVIDELPETQELDSMSDKVSARVGGLSGCIAALGADIKLLGDEIQALQDALRQGRVHEDDPKNVIGYIQTIQETSNPQSGDQVWQVTLTHVRGVGQDMDRNGIPGDDLESAISFGEDGFLDTKYHSENIGDDVYTPLFGTKSIIDLPGVQGSYDNMVREPLDLEAASIDDILSRLKHPAVCKKRYWEDPEQGVLPSKPDVTFAAAWLVRQYALFKAGSPRTSFEIFDWLERLTTRPWMTFPDAYRGFPLGWSRTQENASRMPATAYEPWESDAVVYGYGLADQLARELVPDQARSRENQPPLGFFARSFVPPYTSELTAASARTVDLALGNLDPASGSAVRSYLKFGEALADNEAALLRDRQRAVLRYLVDLSHKTSSRRD